MKKFFKLFLYVFLLSSSLKAQTLPTMPTGGPDNGTYDMSDRYPAGSVKNVTFYSSVAGKNVEMWVYTPPGYSTEQKYGVILCYQGMGDKAANVFTGAWVKAGIVCDNLIGEGKISKGVIIVAVDDQFAGNYCNVQDMTIRDAIPYIDSHYSTYADADHRGLFGYSWGGGYTFNIGCKNLNYFHYLSPSSAAPNKEGDNTLFSNGGATAKQVMKCLFISWAQYDYQSIIDANVATVNYCSNNDIPKYSWAAQGQGHSGGTWRPAMWNFLQLADRAGISADSGTPTTINPNIVDVEKNEVLLFPNPFTSETNLRIENPEQVTSIEVLDMTGKQMEVIDHTNIKNIQPIGSSLKAGIYMVQVCRPNKNQSFKIVKK